MENNCEELEEDILEKNREKLRNRMQRTPKANKAEKTKSPKAVKKVRIIIFFFFFFLSNKTNF